MNEYSKNNNTSTKEVDYIIVGQGITGSLLAHTLLQKGKTIHVFDNYHKNSSSKVAAGIINPVTGRRVVKSWLIDELIPFAKKTYQDLEEKLGIKIYYERNVIRILFSIKDENKWLEKTGDETIAKYVLENENLGCFSSKINEGEGVGEIQYSSQVDMPLFLEKTKAILLDQAMMKVERFDYQGVRLGDDAVFYQNIKAKKIIFCEGQQGRNNPWFGELPFEVAKGEVLLVKIPNANFDKILKHKLFVVPLQNELYWIGSTYDWDSPNDLPTEEAKQLLIHKLKKILTIPFEVVAHQAAIRPTTYDRRPMIGLHPENVLLGIVNGMGTKGASLAPYFVNQFVEYLLEDGVLNSEADVSRFS